MGTGKGWEHAVAGHRTWTVLDTGHWHAGLGIGHWPVLLRTALGCKVYSVQCTVVTRHWAATKMLVITVDQHPFSNFVHRFS